MHPSAKRFAHLLALAITTVSTSLAVAGPREDTDAFVDRAAQAVMQQHGIPGIAIAVTSAGEQRFYNFGIASKATQMPVTDDTLFEIGSVSKIFTVTLAALAELSGKLSLSDSPARHIPELKGSRLEDVSLINLATHTTGGFPLQLPDKIESYQQLIAYYQAWQPQFAIGSHRSYANPSIGLLSMVAGRSLGSSYTEAVKTHLLSKLGMFDTHFDVPIDARARYAQGYNKDDMPVRLNVSILSAEAYGVKTTSKDLLSFIEANLGLKMTDPIQQAMAITRTGHYRVGEMTQDLIWEQYRYPVKLKALLEGNASKMALQSLPVTPIEPAMPPQQAVWINKTGSTNGFGAYVAFVPSEKIGIVLLANKYYPNEERVKLAHQILSAFSGRR